MNNEELLEKTKKDYPKGTIFKSAFSGDKYSSSGIYNMERGGIRDTVGSKPWFYFNGVWAKIVLPAVKSEEVIDNYSIF